jgi:hypothetical protein
MFQEATLIVLGADLSASSSSASPLFCSSFDLGLDLKKKLLMGSLLVDDEQFLAGLWLSSPLL